MSSLLTPSESLAFNGFLSAVDVSDVLEWSSLTGANAHAQLAEHLQPPRGKEALAKATKELMSLEGPDLANEHSANANALNGSANGKERAAGSRSAFESIGAPPRTATTTSSWPAFGSDLPRASNPIQYSYGFGASSHGYRPSESSSKSSNRQNPQDHPWGSQHPISGQPPPHSQSESSVRNQSPSSSSSSAFVLPPLSDYHSPQYSVNGNGRPSSVSFQSAPAVLTQPGSSSSSLAHSKRTLPSHEQTQDPTSTKRRRPSTNDSTTESKPRPGSILTFPSHSHASSSSSTSTTPTSEHHHSQFKDSSVTGGGGGARQSLLSPSQKRANHIQSEQKRRANIRRGYEALCEAVPALREAIKLEEREGSAGGVSGISVLDPSTKARPSTTTTKKKKKGKGPADANTNGSNASSNGVGAGAEEMQDGKAGFGLDGRAGPRSENVVLQKTIDHLHALLASRAELLQRLQAARARLPPDHPALSVSPSHIDEKTGKALWEREWDGGTGRGVVEDEGE